MSRSYRPGGGCPWICQDCRSRHNYPFIHLAAPRDPNFSLMPIRGLPTAAQNIGESIRTSARTYVCFPSDQERRMPSSSWTLRTGHSGLRAGIVARAKCSTLQGEHQRSGENQARATVSGRSTSDGEWRRDVKVGRGGERLQGASPVKAGGPELLREASSWQPLGLRPAPPLGNGRLLETGAYGSGNGVNYTPQP